MRLAWLAVMRSIVVHHRVPGKSLLNLMIALCPGCHSKVHRTKAVLVEGDLRDGSFHSIALITPLRVRSLIVRSGYYAPVR